MARASMLRRTVNTAYTVSHFLVEANEVNVRDVASRGQRGGLVAFVPPVFSLAQKHGRQPDHTGLYLEFHGVPSENLNPIFPDLEQPLYRSLERLAVSSMRHVSPFYFVPNL